MRNGQIIVKKMENNRNEKHRQAELNSKHNRPEGGIEPLCLPTATGLKPAHRTTDAHLGRSLVHC